MKEIPVVRYYNRVTQELEIEPIMGDGVLRFAYNTMAGRSLWGLLFSNAVMTRLFGWYFSTHYSRRHIPNTVRNLSIDMHEAVRTMDEYKSFNDFFSRRLDMLYRPFEHAKTQLVSPADGRIMVYTHLRAEAAIPVKGAKRTLNALCGNQLSSDVHYAVAVVRLCPGDYHRYHFPCDCRLVGAPLKIDGKYHSVNPLAIRRNPDIWVENARVVTTYDSEMFGRFYFIEVGAFGVGSINNTAAGETFAKMDEKGYFAFGASTVILVFDDAKIVFDSDLIANSAEAYETRVKTGNSIADARVLHQTH